MSWRLTKWQPDTCACVILFKWDDEVAEDVRVHEPVSITPCPLHAAQPQLVQRWDAVTEHNTRKNKVVNRIKTEHQLEDADVSWSYDGDVLTVQAGKLTGHQRQALRAACDAEHGSGKVVVAD